MDQGRAPFERPEHWLTPEDGGRLPLSRNCAASPLNTKRSGLVAWFITTT